MDRKTFIKKTLGALLIAAPSYAILSCTTSDDSFVNNPPLTGLGDCMANGASATAITGNHGHSLTVSSADVNAGVEKTYNITGSGDHSHNVTLSVADFNVLKSNQQITLTSTQGGGHQHSVTVSCA